MRPDDPISDSLPSPCLAVRQAMAVLGEGPGVGVNNESPQHPIGQDIHFQPVALTVGEAVVTRPRDHGGIIGA